MGGKGKGEGKGKRDEPVGRGDEHAFAAADDVPAEAPEDQDNLLLQARVTTVDVSGRPLRNGLFVVY
eukprot:CAMPEP_0194481914 /NCGR_PEP_ID=MMETSP0253-20130528/4113_1 /TAXON_ID=2966 /ORGANISM="Noctiluca scintillans" /LENGTH=66 /DNA_ID=CAMNT_0039321423 /DNA_START=47 /DNA_END=247 /DNA_ORIENTATION=-